MSETVANIIASGLELHNVDQIFCVPGESYVGLSSILINHDSIKTVVCRHEAGAAFMAAADGRLRNRAGVAMVSRGPGLANSMVALHSAYHDATPLVVIIGQVERNDFGRLALQEQNYSLLLADITKAVFEVNQPDMASEILARAFHLAESGTPGPVAVVMPEDIFDQKTWINAVGPSTKVSASPRTKDINALVDMISASQRPLVLVGGALLAEAVSEEGVLSKLNTLAETYALPICPTHRRPHLFDAQHPNYGGYMGIRVPGPLISEMKKADLLIALGERLTDTVSQSYTFPTAPQPQIPLVHVWPDANEVGRVWHPILGIPASPKEVIEALLGRKTPKITKERLKWIEKLNKIHIQLTNKTWDSTTDGVNFAAVVSEVDKHLSDTAAITTDAGNFGSFVHRYINFKQSHVFLSSVVGAMGSGVPMAIAAGLRRPNDQVVCFIGDGGILMMGNEIATARQYNINPTIIISDNSMYGTIGMHSYVRYPNRAFMNATKLTNPDFTKWAESFGAAGLTISNEHEIAEKVSKAFNIKDRPVVLHCKTSAQQMSAWRRYEGGEALP